MTPGRKFSRTTSAERQRSVAFFTSVGFLRSKTTERLFLFSEAKFSEKPARCGGQFRIPSPSGDSTLITSAPMSASSMPAKGPAAIWQNSITRTPLRGVMDGKLPPRLGIVILLVAATCFASNHLAARFAFDHGASVASAVTTRATSTALVLLVMMRLQGVSLALPRGLRAAAAAAGVLIAAQSYCLYSAVAIIPPALALLVFQTSPMLYLLLCWALGKEPPRLSALPPMLLGLVGLALALDLRTTQLAA